MAFKNTFIWIMVFIVIVAAMLQAAPAAIRDAADRVNNADVQSNPLYAPDNALFNPDVK